jgi:hypothetical protein
LQTARDRRPFHDDNETEPTPSPISTLAAIAKNDAKPQTNAFDAPRRVEQQQKLKQHNNKDDDDNNHNDDDEDDDDGGDEDD